MENGKGLLLSAWQPKKGRQHEPEPRSPIAPSLLCGWAKYLQPFQAMLTLSASNVPQEADPENLHNWARWTFGSWVGFTDGGTKKLKRRRMGREAS